MWESLIPIIAEYGLPLAESLFKKWSSGTPPVQADFDELKALASQKASDEMLKVLAAQGIDPKSPQGLAFLALTQ